MFQSLITHIEANAIHVIKTQHTPHRAVFTANYKRERLVLERRRNGRVFAVLRVLNEHADRLPIPSLAGGGRQVCMIVRTDEGEYDGMKIVSWRMDEEYDTIRFNLKSTSFPLVAVMRLANALNMEAVPVETTDE